MNLLIQGRFVPHGHALSTGIGRSLQGDQGIGVVRQLDGPLGETGRSASLGAKRCGKKPAGDSSVGILGGCGGLRGTQAVDPRPDLTEDRAVGLGCRCIRWRRRGALAAECQRPHQGDETMSLHASQVTTIKALVHPTARYNAGCRLTPGCPWCRVPCSPAARRSWPSGIALRFHLS